MEYQDIVKKIFEIIKDTDIEEVKISKDGGFSVSILREVPPQNTNAQSPTSHKTIEARETTSPQSEEESVSSSLTKNKRKRRIPIKSPMVGRFFNSAGPDKPPYVMKGNHVEYGEKLGVVEAMKIYKDVTSSVKGVIVDVLVENNTPVEYGQEIYLVETDE